MTLTAPDGTTSVASEVAGDGSNFDARYDVAVGALTIGQPYHLRVATTDGMIAEGDAIVPATQPQTLAERRLDPTRDTLRLAWPRAAGARAYEVRISQLIPQQDSTGGSGGYAPGGTRVFRGG